MALSLLVSAPILIVFLACFTSLRTNTNTLVSAWSSTPAKHLLLSRKTQPFPSRLSAVVSSDGGAAMAKSTSTTPPSRVLFVGNSLTYVNNVDQWVKDLRKSSVQGGSFPDFETAKCVKGGASLKKLWQKTKAKREIANGRFDVVVLQEDLPETSVELFENFCRKFVAAARDANATPLLYQTWAYQRLPDMTNEDICQAHQTISEELGVEIANVGSARMKVAQEMPHLNLWADDREHPSEVGAYLAALVLYRALFQDPTLGIAHRPEGLAEEDATVLQRMVDEVDFK